MISSTPRMTPDEVAGRSFPTSFRGISETDVRAFLKRVAEELGAARGREQELMNTIDELETRLRNPQPLDEHELLDALGEETTRLLRSAREAASDIRGKAEERAARLVHDAHEEAQRLRQEADDVLGVRTQEADSVAAGMLEEAEQRASDLMRVADERGAEVRVAADRYAEELRSRADHEAANALESARERGASLLEAATTMRQRVIDDLGRRRELLSGQLEELRTGRDQLLDAYRVVKRTFLEATEALAQVEARATAGRPAPGTDPVDLDETLAAESEAARAAGLEPAAEPATDSEAAAAPDDGAPDASPPDAPLPDDAQLGSDQPAADTPASDEAQPDDAAPNLADVDDLFARLRAGSQTDAADAEAEPAPAEAPGTPEPLAGSGAAAAETVETPETPETVETVDAVDEAPAWLTRRDDALAPLKAVLVRQVKLAIGNEQNEVLDKARRQKGRLVAAAALPDLDAQIEAWGAVLASASAQAYRLAGDEPDSDAVAVPDDLVSELARAMVEPLRDRLVATIDGGHEPGETSNQVAERIGARYREWKNRSAESSVQDALVAAYSRGYYDRCATGALLSWRVPPSGCCVDCSDNALEPTRKGAAFPTGQAYPPAHPGCRCALTSEDPDVILSDGTESVDAESTSQS